MPYLTKPSENTQKLLEEMTELLEAGLIPSRIFNDPEIHQLELERVFTSAWIFIAHESEIPGSGDYVLRYIGNDPYIVSRGADGKIHVLLNACRHRGAHVCRAEKGNSASFLCPYHGWNYKNTGDLIGIPAYNDGYKKLNRAEWGLLEAPHVDSIHGFIFASLDPDAPSLEEYLGGMKWYLDMIFGLHDGGWEVIGTPNRWIIEANWKTGAENFAGDNYHTLTTHKSLFDIGIYPVPPQANMSGYHIQAGNGHSLSLSIAPNMDDPGPKFWGLPKEVVEKFDKGKLSAEQYEIAMRSRNSMGNIFPNFSFIKVPITPDPKRIPPATFTRVWYWRPLGPDKIEEWTWILVPKNTSQEFKENSYRAGMTAFGPAGIFEQDDTTPWKGIVRSAGSVNFGQTGVHLNYQMGLEGMGIAKKVTDWPGPGNVYYPRYEERVALSLYRQWLHYMSSK